MLGTDSVTLPSPHGESSSTGTRQRHALGLATQPGRAETVTSQRERCCCHLVNGSHWVAHHPLLNISDLIITQVWWLDVHNVTT